MRKVNPSPAHSNNLSERIIPEAGALSEWQSEVARGKRRKTEIDALTRAACKEAAAREALKNGLPSLANQYRMEAAEIVVKALIEEAAA
jgi:hypothetical protein